MRILLVAAALLTLTACEKKPAELPKPKPRPAPIHFENLPNYQKAIMRMKRMEHTPATIRQARRAMPDVLAKAEARYLKHPAAKTTCIAWDRVADNAIRQNDAALVHLWGTLADRRCAASGEAARYWEAQ